MKLVFALSFALLVSACALTSLEGTTDREERQNLIDAALKSGNKDFALLVAQRHVEENPNDAGAYGAYGRLLLESGRCREAIIALRRAGTLGSTQWHPLLVKSYLRCAHFDKALALIEQLGDGDDPNLLNMKGVALDNLARHRAAQEAYRQSLARRPEHPTVMYNLALSLLLSGKSGESFALLAEVKDQDVANDIAGHSLVFFESVALAMDGRLRQARRALSQILPEDQVDSVLSIVKK